MSKPLPTKDDERPRALVTGASAGIGAAFATRLARAGYDLVLVARSGDTLKRQAFALSDKFRVSVEALPADLIDPAQLKVVESYVAADERLTLLVNNAGFGTMGRFHELDVDKEESEIRLNVLALVRLTRAALPGMVARADGAIINVSSMASFQAAPFNATYAATKAYINSFTESLYEELRGTNVRVQALCPGFTRTEFQQRAGIDVTGVPSMAWMSADDVVEASLAALQRRDLICVPGMSNKIVSTLTSALPRSITRRLAGMLASSVLGGDDKK